MEEQKKFTSELDHFLQEFEIDEKSKMVIKIDTWIILKIFSRKLNYFAYKKKISNFTEI